MALEISIEDVSAPEDALKVAERIWRTGRRMGLYVGAALERPGQAHPDVLLREAGTAMDLARNKGSGPEIFDPKLRQIA